MKKIIFALGISLFLSQGAPLFAQDPDTHLKNARSAFASGDLEGARFALQEAMNALDLAIGEELMKLLPDKMGDLGFDASQDQLGVGNMGFAGLHLSRQYGNAEKTSVTVSVIADSPLLAGINAVLALPFMGGDSGQKRIRLGGFRGLLQRSEDGNGDISWDMQIPFGSSLLTLAFKGIPDEHSVMAMAQSIPLDQMARLLQ
ncbi:MAG: hypothetical protein RBS53_11005 [Bacteroidales bacterium]|jgi:hypothetical protein|nr:hypothetical protein [Bacteroidales bacterium]NLM93799.1 hypothetical protein [Bacteroidales bacterium]